MNQRPLKPVGIHADRQAASINIRWSDGHLSNYSFTLVRIACPCAQCQGGHEHMRSEPDPSVFSLPEEDTPATRIRSLEAVGTYALTIEWEDGHNYGVYHWNYLRKLCPCIECRPEVIDAGG